MSSKVIPTKPVRLLSAAAFLTLGFAGPVLSVERLTEIPSLTVPNVVLDFDQMPKGPTTVADINAAFADAGLEDLAFTIFDTGNTNYRTTIATRSTTPAAW